MKSLPIRFILSPVRLSSNHKILIHLLELEDVWKLWVSTNLCRKRLTIIQHSSRAHWAVSSCTVSIMAVVAAASTWGD